MPISAANMALYPGGSIRSPEWLEIRERIRRRADNKCEWCGVANHALGGRLSDGRFLHALPKGDDGLKTLWPKPGERYWCGGQVEPINLKIIRIVCTVAHIDGELTDHSDDNLAFVCQRCHLRHDKTQHAKSRRARKHIGQTDIEDLLQPKGPTE